MSNKKQNIIVYATLGLFLIFVLGSMISDFKLYDILYIVGIIVYILKYKLQKSI